MRLPGCAPSDDLPAETVFGRCERPNLAHREIRRHPKTRSLSEHGGHGRTCCRLDPVAIDPYATSRSIANMIQLASVDRSMAAWYRPPAT
jgi:hypothetical protein